MIFTVTLKALNSRGTHDQLQIDQADVVSRVNAPGGGSTVVTVSMGTITVLERGPDFQAQIDAAANPPPFVRNQIFDTVGLPQSLLNYIDTNKLSPNDVLRRALSSDANLTALATQLGVRVVDVVILLLRIARTAEVRDAEDGIVNQIGPVVIAALKKIP